MSEAIRPYRIEVEDAALDDLRARLSRTRFPEAETVDDWSQGIPLAYVRELCAYWRDSYDWRRIEARLNALPQFKTELDGVDVHFLHIRSAAAQAKPLVMTHGWPGSIIEFMKVIGPLSNPAAHGGSDADAFHLVIPTIPGYGFSDKPTETGWGTDRIAAAWSVLMARLGHDRYFAQGGDWGAVIAASIGAHDPEHCIGVHTNMAVVAPTPEMLAEPTEQEQDAIAAQKFYQDWDSGYSRQQSTRPQTLGYGLVDSPAGQAAWIVEKFYQWTDCAGHPEHVLSRDEILDNVMFLLAHRCRCVVRAPLLGEFRARLDQRRERPSRYERLPEGDPQSIAALGGDPLQGPAVLQRARQGRPLRRIREARGVRSGTAQLLRDHAVNRDRRADGNDRIDDGRTRAAKLGRALAGRPFGDRGRRPAPPCSSRVLRRR